MGGDGEGWNGKLWQEEEPGIKELTVEGLRGCAGDGGAGWELPK